MLRIPVRVPLTTGNRRQLGFQVQVSRVVAPVDPGAVASGAMKPFLGAFLGACLLLGSARPALAFQRLASITVTNLTCEYLVNPLGLDTPQPRLGWQLAAVNPASRGQRQIAYRLLVSRSPESLSRDQGELWDSGRVVSGQSQLVPYAGLPLRAGQACWWKVAVWDEDNRRTTWSEPARWTIGPLAATDWTAEWIGSDQVFTRQPGWPPPDNTLPDPWLRKRFTLDRVPQRALIAVASVGYHELHVNGQRVGDGVLAPAATDHTKRARYVTYDIAPLLRSGENVIGLWLGTAWSIFPSYRTPDKPATPLVIAQADLTYADGTTQRLATDASWKWHPSANTLIGVWDFTHFGGESFDARRDIPGWASNGLDESDWKAVTVYHPKLALSAQQVEPNRRVQSLKPVAIAEPRPGVWRVDFGRTFAGWIEIKLAGQAGDRIQFRWSERPDEAMTHRLHSEYIIGPTGRGTFCNRFNYGVGRWVQLEGLRQRPSIDDIQGWLIRTDYAPAGGFASSDPTLNAIHAATLWTFENLSLGGYVVDCPQRERMGYGGDAHATTATALDHFKLGAFYTKWSEDWRDVQGQSAAWGVDRKEGDAGAGNRIEPGNLPYTAPTYWGGGGPGWSGYCVTLPWEIHRRYGDRRILEVNFPTIERWLAFLDTKAKEDLLRRWGGEWDFLGDWLWPGADGVNGDTRETLFFNNCYWIYNLQTAAAIATALGRTDRAAAWQARAEAVRAAVHREFFRPAENSYVNGSQAYLALALLTRVPPASVRDAVWKRFEEEIRVVRRGHFWAGITGGSFVVRELIEAERPDLMHLMATQPDYPGWAHMLRNGATTLWEDWEGKLSWCHSSYLHLGAWFIEGLGGIRPGPDGRGYQDFVLRPGLWNQAPLGWVETHFDSPYGRIVSQWRRDGDRLRLRFVVPPNTTATAQLPTTDTAKVREGGKPLRPARGVSQIASANAAITVRLQPGAYDFVIVP